MVTKRVVQGELVLFLRKKTTLQLTPEAENSVAGRFVFLAFVRKDLRRYGRGRKSLGFEREQPGVERNPQGFCRTPELRPETLGLSD